jgi:geranylgeranyl diphosphate synthase type II
MDQTRSALIGRATAMSPPDPALAGAGGADGCAGTWSVSHLEAIIDRRLRILLPDQHAAPHALHQAMSYVLLSPGKRLRPVLTMLMSLHFGRRDLLAVDCACAIEMVHAASLVMDDLPSMDDAMLRRGQPTAHRAFGEDIALLTSISLLNLAYGVVSSSPELGAEVRLEIVRTLFGAVGSNGLVGGQALDLRTRSASTPAADLERINALKTGQLIAAACETGALVAGVPPHLLAPVRAVGMELGLAFQIADDVLDGEAYSGRTGKDTGKDRNKPTLASALGQASAVRRYHEHAARCREALAEIGADRGPLAAYLEQCLTHVEV